MVTGFNTDIKFNNIVFHIQTEPRKDAGIETTVYVRGAVIHKLKTSYLDAMNTPGFAEDAVKKILEDQHRQVIAKIRGGEITAPSPAAPQG
jgi:hypothetical protein